MFYNITYYTCLTLFFRVMNTAVQCIHKSINPITAKTLITHVQILVPCTTCDVVIKNVSDHYNWLQKPQELTIGKGAKAHMSQRPKWPELIPVYVLSIKHLPRSIATPTWMGCYSNARLPPSSISPGPMIYTPGWIHRQSGVKFHVSRNNATGEAWIPDLQIRNWRC